ncbi:hypothetical protein [Paraburkholderia tropica]|uniref:hypothetical protein n=1 Tax=Paraburkholderia tropica TaxID=92647 RepID=UPI001591065E|nr:hypothetical protein [Paraburkholderia tropica]
MAKTLSVTMANEYSKPAVCIEMKSGPALLSAVEVDSLIEALCSLRANMQPAVPAEVSRTHKYVMETNPSWYIERHPFYEGAALFLRHSGLGWTSFAIPLQSLRELHMAIGAHVRELESLAALSTLN